MSGLDVTTYPYPYDACAYEERYRKVYEAGAAFWEEHIPTDALVDFLHEINPPKGLKAIDLGCGEGRDSIFLAKMGLDVTSVDAARSAVERAKEYAKTEMVSINFLVADIRNLPIKNEIYDLAINIASLQLIVDQNSRDKHLQETYGVLKHGGRYLSCNYGVDESVSGEEFYKKLEIKPGDLTPRKIKVGSEEREIYLPIIAAWPKSREQYLEEFDRAGFSIVNICKKDVKPVGDCWVLIAKKQPKNTKVSRIC